MNLTVEPLYLISIIVNLTVGFLMLFLYRGRHDRSAQYWFFASSALSLGVGFILFRPLLPPFFSYSVAHALSTFSSILFGYSLILIDEKKPRFLYVAFLVCVVYGLFLVYLMSLGFGSLVPIIIAGAWAISLFIACLMSIKAERALQNSYAGVMTWLFFGSGVLWLMRIPPLALGATQSLGDPGLINAITLIGIVVLGILRQLVYLVIRLSEVFKESQKKDRDKIKEREEALLSGLIALAAKRDNETGAHIVRTANYVRVIASRLKSDGYYPGFLDEGRIDDFYRAAPLHDIGKVGIPDSILNKPSKLTPEEWEIMKTHTSIGESILVTLNARFSDLPSFLRHAIEIAGGHHERWNGTGYPRGLSGEFIPLAARIMAVADVYDALVSRRVYKEPWTHEEACAEIKRLSGTQFDPKIVEALIRELSALKRIQIANKDSLPEKN